MHRDNPGHDGDDGPAMIEVGHTGPENTAPSEMEAILAALEALVARLVPGEPAPIAYWIARLDRMRESDGLTNAEQIQLDDIVARLRALQAQPARLAPH